MIDFTTPELSLFSALYCLIGYLMVFFLFKGYVIVGNNSLRRGEKLQWAIFFTTIMFLCVTCFVGGDFYHYLEWCHNYKFDGNNHGEPIYETIIRILDKNYLIFRILIWGGGLLLIKNACDRQRIDKFLAFFLLFIAFYLIYSYARASFAMAIYYWGLSFLISDKKESGSIVLGIVGILLSYVFHHSMLLCILLTPIIFIPFSRKTILFFIVLCPLFCFILGQIFADFFAQLPMMLDDEYLSNKLTAVGNREDEASNWKGMISNVFHYGRFFLPMVIILKLVYFKDVYNGIIPNSVKYLSIISFYLMLISVSSIFIGLGTYLLFFRILFMTHIPLSLIMAKLYQDGKIPKRKMSRYLIIFLFCSLYGLLYATYTTVSR